jgi:hypothetical protein
MLKVFIDPSNRIKYSSYYIKGLEDFFGKKNISFSSKYFNDLNRKTESHSFDHYMAFVIVKDKTIKKIIIDFRDKITIKQNAYKWCDKYAKINFNKSLTEDQYLEKIISIPPGFGIKLWGFWKTSYYSILNLVRCKLSPLESIKIHFMDYYGMYFRRTYIENYYKNKSGYLKWKTAGLNNTYIFFISTLWQHDNCVTGTNVLRKKFIDLCKMNEKIEFEGGFYSNASHPQYNEYKDIIFLDRYSIDEYIKKTKLSSFVFNTPAVFNCHGWKLGEYLAMGKAIISTPISNEMPEELIHGKNIHIVNNNDELEEAINLLVNDEEYRKNLEMGTNSYYEKYASPKNVIKYILKDLVII